MYTKKKLERIGRLTENIQFALQKTYTDLCSYLF